MPSCPAVHSFDVLVTLVTVLVYPAKSGCEPKDATSLFAFVLRHCDRLHPTGLMTIGRLAPTPQPDCFHTLVQCKAAILDTLAADGVTADGFELSMGMSGDYELAMREGSTMVRIGSAIFGEREYGNKQSEAEDKNASEAKTAQTASGSGAAEQRDDGTGGNNFDDEIERRRS